MKDFFRRINTPLARRIGIYVILASTLLSIFTSGFQVYREYSREKDAVYETFEQIKKTQLSNIASRVWVLDNDELNTALENLLGLSAVKYAAVYESGELLVSVGNDGDENIISRKFTLLYHANNTMNNVGELVVKVSLDKVYQHVLDRAVLIVFSNFIKTLLIAVFILFIFYVLVTRHLSSISSYLSKDNSFSRGDKLSLDRSEKKEDELDVLVDAINNMQRNLKIQFEKIISQRQHLAQTLNSIDDAVITTDINGKIIRINRIAESLTGLESNEATGQSIKSVLSIKDAVTLKEISHPIEKVIETGETVYLDNEVILISGNSERVHIKYSAAPIKDNADNILGMVLVFNDISEKYRLRKEAELNEKKYRMLTSIAPVGLFYTDVNGSCLYVNEKWSEIAGLSFNQARNDGWLDAIYLGDQDKVIAAWDDFVSKDIPFKLEYRFQNGSDIKWVLGQALAEEDAQGNTVGYVGTITDISERKTIEHALNRSQKMDALGKLTGGVAHDYNNMLGVILGYSELLKEQVNDDSKLQEYVEEIYAAGNRGAKLTSKLLSFSRQRSTDPEVIDLNQVLTNGKNMLEKTLTASINLSFELEENIWPINTDSGDLENAIVNLCINAGHAMNGRGDINIRTSNAYINDEHYVCLTITDTGCGISDDEKEKIFDPFYSTKGEAGTGLGLSQVYGFISRAGGIIDIDSKVGMGTSFVLLFPRYIEVDKSVDTTGENETNSSDKGNETILVVDDELPLLSLCSEILGNKGYNVFTAAGGEEALEILEKKHVDLLLSDVVMPNMNGYELAAIVQEKYPEVKIQMASGYTGDNKEIGESEELNKNILHKPYRIDSLLKRIRELLD